MLAKEETPITKKYYPVKFLWKEIGFVYINGRLNFSVTELVSSAPQMLP